MSTEYYIDSTEFFEELPSNQWDDECAGLVDDLNDYVQTNLSDKLKKGDTITLIPEKERYRNDFVFFYDGVSVSELSSDFDEYGHVPSNIYVSDNEFYPRYWADTISHNSIFFLSPEIEGRMVFSLDESENIVKANVKIGDKEYVCLLDNLEDFKDVDFSEGISLNELAEKYTLYYEYYASEFDSPRLDGNLDGNGNILDTFDGKECFYLKMKDI